MKKEELEKRVDDFVKKYQGKERGYPTDDYYKGECLSIVKLYIKEVFGISPPPSGSNSAFGYWSNFPNPLGEVFERVPLSANEKPFKGCIPIWDTSVGFGFGHIDIFLEGDNNKFKGYDQNWNGRQAHTQEHNYSNVVGYLKPKNVTINGKNMEITDQTKLTVGKRMINGREVVLGTVEFGAVKSMLFDLIRDNENLQKTNKDNAESILAFTENLRQIQKWLSDIGGKGETIKEKIDSLEVKLNTPVENRDAIELLRLGIMKLLGLK